jgi:peptide/nickel transport system permease protein
VLVEVTFSLPGAGARLVNAVQDKDLPVVQGITLLVAAAIILVNIVVDVLYVLVDKRIRLGHAT